MVTAANQMKFDPGLFDASTRNLAPALERLKRFHPAGMELTLARIHRLLDALGNPEKKLPPVFHVGGTNGKGSTIAFLRSVLEESGYKAHAYTSPHLVTYNERIRIAGRLIDDDQLAALIDEVEEANGDQEISFFEITTAMALHVFAKHPADAVLLEVGLGGILDATNVIDAPAATAITRISYDHTHILGNRIEQIAGEKAGIVKPNVPVVLAWQKEKAARDIIAERAARLGASLIEYAVDWTVEREGDRFAYCDGQGRLDLPLPGLTGAHQVMNAGTALAMLRHADGFAKRKFNFARGMTAVEWPARLQRLTAGPLARRLPQGCELWLDGGHNDSGGEVLAQQAKAWAAESDALPLCVVFGMLRTKNAGEFLSALATYVSQLCAIEIPGEPLSLSAQQAAEAASQAGIKTDVAGDALDAIDRLVKDGGRKRILICGSLYLAGKILGMAQ